jgi:hypothetical protein
MSLFAAFPSFAGRQGTESFEGIPVLQRLISERSTPMAGYYHEPVVHPNCLYGKEVLETVIQQLLDHAQVPSSLCQPIIPHTMRTGFQ